MNVYEVGQTIPSFVGHAEETQFDFSNTGATMIVFFRSPKPSEIAAFHFDQPFELRLTVFDSALVLTVKIGTLAWMDAPYTPHLSQHLTKLDVPGESEGYALQLYLVDAVTGKIEHMRLIGLSHAFSLRLREGVIGLLNQPFDHPSYHQYIASLFSRFSTRQLAEMAVAKSRTKS